MEQLTICWPFQVGPAGPLRTWRTTYNTAAAQTTLTWLLLEHDNIVLNKIKFQYTLDLFIRFLSLSLIKSDRNCLISFLSCLLRQKWGWWNPGTSFGTIEMPLISKLKALLDFNNFQKNGLKITTGKSSLLKNLWFSKKKHLNTYFRTTPQFCSFYASLPQVTMIMIVRELPMHIVYFVQYIFPRNRTSSDLS